MPGALIKFGYNGRAFDSFSHQNIADPPDTVEKRLLEALGTIHGLDGGAEGIKHSLDYKSASRTDKGVSALGNVFFITTRMEPPDLIKSLNSLVSGCFFWAWAPVDEDFRPRHARSRWYRYYMPDVYDDIEYDRMGRVAKVFYGDNDFRHFSKPDPSRPDLSTKREIELIEIGRGDGSVILDLKAGSFLWHMVRKIVWALQKGAVDELSITTIYNHLMLEEDSLEVGLAPAEPLVLMDVEYDGVDFTRVEGVNKKELLKRMDSLKQELNFLDLAAEKILE